MKFRSAKRKKPRQETEIPSAAKKAKMGDDKSEKKPTKKKGKTDKNPRKDSGKAQ
jgi:hypothetical protein